MVVRTNIHLDGIKRYISNEPGKMSIEWAQSNWYRETTALLIQLAKVQDFVNKMTATHMYLLNQHIHTVWSYCILSHHQRLKWWLKNVESIISCIMRCRMAYLIWLLPNELFFCEIHPRCKWLFHISSKLFYCCKQAA